MDKNNLPAMSVWIAERIESVMNKQGKLEWVKGEIPRTPELMAQIRDLYQKASAHIGLNIPPTQEETFYKLVLDEVLGFGPIQPHINDDSLTEIMVNRADQVYVERGGHLILTDTRFVDDDHVIRIIKKIIEPLGRKVDYRRPLVDARLPDGSRVNAVIPPCAIDGPNITIRKFSKTRFTVQDLVNFGSLTDEMANYLEACVVSMLNVIVSGGTGSGKTTLLNVLSGFIPNDHRIVTIEDAAELSLAQEHVVRLETKHAADDTDTAVPIRQLVINSLRMRPERIVVGECRGGEALDMLQAMNTGHDGSLTTIHANTPRDCLSRLETLVLMAGMDLPVRVVRQQVASAVQLIVQQARLRDGSRKVVQISEVTGMEGENIVMQDIFKFEDQGDGPDGKVKGEILPCGLRPYYDRRLRTHGFNLPAALFMKSASQRASSRRRR